MHYGSVCIHDMLPLVSDCVHGDGALKVCEVAPRSIWHVCQFRTVAGTSVLLVKLSHVLVVEMLALDSWVKEYMHPFTPLPEPLLCFVL